MAERDVLRRSRDRLGGDREEVADCELALAAGRYRAGDVEVGCEHVALVGVERVAESLEKRLFPKRYSRPPKVLPRDVEKSLDRLPEEDRDRVRAHLERDFASYLRDEHAKDPPNARNAAWKTYELLLGTVGARAARELVKYLFEDPRRDSMDESL